LKEGEKKKKISSQRRRYLIFSKGPLSHPEGREPSGLRGRPPLWARTFEFDLFKELLVGGRGEIKDPREVRKKLRGRGAS